MSIGALAAAAGVSVETVRYYQRRGLLARPDRRYGTIRRYTAADRERLLFVRRAQRLGFTLDEIAQLLALDAVRDRAEARALAAARRDDIDARVADLLAMRRALDALIEHCSHGRASEPCPIIDAFRHAPPPAAD
ncbi:MerR family transcriptional regulator [Plasticicumulans lactativorans]|nr:MerR family transcriptional regulator [Plasticicumulans lactativorans]